ncbi:MAG TPA: helix-turn-helix domain-containing protein [Chloroflexota bacterium]|nr:helix-turn-helix domain-containing protein [Chloroflexota bacterium]
MKCTRWVIEENARLARIFRALGDQTRLRLIAELVVRGEVTCGEFAAQCDCANSTLTYHQRILSEAGLISVRRAGQFRMLVLQREILEAALPGVSTRLAAMAGLGKPMTAGTARTAAPA